MKIKRFFSSDMRTVIRMVREELGADAVILSNSRVNGGVEVVAAIDYDESIFKTGENDAGENKPAQIPGVGKAVTGSRPPENKSAGSDNRADYHRQEDYASLREPVNQPARNQKNTAQPAAAPTNQPEHNAPAAIPAQHYSQDITAEQTTRPAEEPASGNQKYSAEIEHVEFDDLSDQQRKNSDFSFYMPDDESDDKDSEPQYQSDGTLFDTSEDISQGYSNISDLASESDKPASSSVWSQEPTLVEMRKDIQTLRGLLEHQLTGLAWGDLARKNPVRAKLLRQLLELDINPPLAGKIADAASKHKDFEKAWQAALNLVTHNLPTISDDMIGKGGIIALVGPTGVGKTTSVAKLAARYALGHGRNRVALVTTDCFRIAAHEQLRTYGRILGMPVRIATDRQELTETLKSFSDKDLVLIDTAGMSHRDVRLVEQFSMISESAPSIKSLLVMSASTHRNGLDEIVRVFRNVKLDGCVLTKIDETTSLAGCLSVAIEHQLPIAYVGNGQKVPEDLHLARAHSLVNQSVLIARKTNQPMGEESLELAFNKVKSDAYV